MRDLNFEEAFFFAIDKWISKFFACGKRTLGTILTLSNDGRKASSNRKFQNYAFSYFEAPTCSDEYHI